MSAAFKQWLPILLMQVLALCLMPIWFGLHPIAVVFLVWIGISIRHLRREWRA